MKEQNMPHAGGSQLCENNIATGIYRTVSGNNTRNRIHLLLGRTAIHIAL
jgi:hypothetical protein